ncbi:response regulator [Chryseolinea sp. H1M3-3]|uniref:response regulator n=1 Tax=Chryseolinea sp. H1M3-3 TaxID=3034144 RepID=UPI0023EC3DE2|nr:response regulator [Chryseolinea sp. H1M3-3]
MVALYIDDDEEDVEFFVEAIKTIDPACSCVTAVNGRDGLKTLEAVTPDIIFLDINMPVLNGKETLRLLKSSTRFHKIPVFMISTSKNPDEISICTQLGANDFIIKPNTFSELCKTLERIFESQKQTSIDSNSDAFNLS